MKKIFLLTAGIVLLGVSLYAGSGDLIVNGNLGVGTSAPTERLHMKSGGLLLDNFGSLFLNNELSTAIRIGSGYTGGWSRGYGWVDANNATMGMIGATGDANNGTGSLSSIYLGKSYSQQWLTINNSGNVGIGTSSPSAKLDVAGIVKASTIETDKIGITGYYRSFARIYTVNTTTSSALLDYDGNPLPLEKAYRIRAHIAGTSTPTGVVAVIYNDASGTRFINKVYEAGNTSNHVEIYMDNNTPKVRLYNHPTLYSVLVHIDEATGSTVRGKAGFLESPEIYTLDSSVGIGTTSPKAKLDVNGDIHTGGDKIELGGSKTGNHYSYIDLRGDDTYTDYGLRLLRGNGGPNTWSQLAHRGTGGLYLTAQEPSPIYFQVNSATKVVIDSLGAFHTYGPAFTPGGVWAGSDIKYKKNVSNINGALDTVMKIQGVSYEYNKDDNKEISFPDGRHYGVIAQEIEKVLPSIVRDDNEGKKAVNYTELIAVLIEAVKEQQKQIDDLKGKLSNVK